MTEEERERLAAAYLAGGLNAAAEAALLAELRAEPAFAERVAELLIIERLLKTELSGATPNAFAREVVERLKADMTAQDFTAKVVARARTNHRRKSPARLPRHARPARPAHYWPWLAAASFLIALTGYLLLKQTGEPLSGKPVIAEKVPPVPQIINPEASRPVPLPPLPPSDKPAIAAAPAADVPPETEASSAQANEPFTLPAEVASSDKPAPATPTLPAPAAPTADVPPESLASNSQVSEPLALLNPDKVSSSDKPAIAAPAAAATPTPPAPAAPAAAVATVAPGSDPWRGKRLAATDTPLMQDLDGYCQLTLEPNSQLVINGGPRARKASLEQGSVTCEVKKNVGAFEVASKLGTVALRGTKFKVSLSEAGEGEALYGRLSVAVFDGMVLLTTPGGTSTVLTAERDKPHEGGVLTGILTGGGGTKRNPTLLVIADGEDKEVTYLPREANGGFDKNMLAHLYPRNRVLLAWVAADYRRLLALQPITPKTNAGKVTGVVLRKSGWWIDVQTPGWAGGSLYQLLSLPYRPRRQDSAPDPGGESGRNPKRRHRHARLELYSGQLQTR